MKGQNDVKETKDLKAEWMDSKALDWPGKGHFRVHKYYFSKSL